MSLDLSERKALTDEALEEINRELGPYKRFKSAPEVEGLSLPEAESLLKGLADLRPRLLGKKSKVNQLKKLIGRIPDQLERHGFGQLVLGIEVQTESDFGE